MKKNIRSKFINIYTIFGFLLLFISLVLVAIPVTPYIWYRINNKATEEDIIKITKEITEDEIKEESKSTNVPEFDETLPEGYFVLIPEIGIDSPISTSSDYTKALKSGSWIVPDYGTPERDTLPIILASHRFGYSSWSIETRNKISYYNLPKTDIGDEVIIYWNQRKYTYKIYSKEESNYISDYSADLILYTCKYFNSPVRIFRYAERVD